MQEGEMVRETALGYSMPQAPAALRNGGARNGHQQQEEDTITFITPEGETVVVYDWPEDMASVVMMAAEMRDGQAWDTSEEDAGCRRLLEGM
jgi:hypothetical protein